LEESVTEALWRTRQEKRTGIRDGQSSPSEWRKSIVLLLRQQVVLRAMKDGRAPLPVSATLWKGLLRRGVLNDLDDLGSIARRLSFLRDERMLLAELRIRTSTTPPVRKTLSKEGEIAAEDRPQIEDGHKCQ
jgi:hypothetical protein